MVSAARVPVRGLVAVVLALASGCAAGQPSGAPDGSYQAQAVPAPDGQAPVVQEPDRAPPLLLDLPAGLPLPPDGSRAWPTGRPATANEAQTYARAVLALRRAPFRVVERDVLHPGVEVVDEDPGALVVRTAVLEEGGAAVVTRMDVQRRTLRAAGASYDYRDDVTVGDERWLEQEYGSPSDSPTLYTLDRAVHCPEGCPLHVVEPGTYVLLPREGDEELGSRSEVVLAGDRIVSWHTWYPEDIGNASDAGEYASLLLDLPPDPGLRAPDPATVVSVAEQARRTEQRDAERDRQEQQATRSCSEPVNGRVVCAEQQPGPAALLPGDGAAPARR